MTEKTAGPSSPVAAEPELASLLPAIYRDGRGVTAVYAISPEQARNAVMPRNLHPTVLPGQRALAVVSWFDYFDSTLGPYRELAVGVVVSPHRSFGLSSGFDLMSSNPETGAWLLSLPVSTGLACRGGVEIFGYPKIICNFGVEYLSRRCLVTVESESTAILWASFPLGWGPKIPVRWLVTYSEKDGQLLKARIEAHWQVTLSSGRGTSLQIRDPHHPLSQALQQLALPPKPLFVLHGDRFRAILSAGERVPASS